MGLKLNLRLQPAGARGVPPPEIDRRTGSGELGSSSCVEAAGGGDSAQPIVERSLQTWRGKAGDVGGESGGPSKPPASTRDMSESSGYKIFGSRLGNSVSMIEGSRD